MENNQGIPTQIIEKFLSGKLSVSEEKELLDWFNTTPDNYVIFQNEQKRLRPIIAKRNEEEVTIQWKKLFYKIQRKPITRQYRSKWLFGSAAAAILLIALILVSVLENNNAGQLQAKNVTEVITPCGEKTSLILPDGTSVVLNSGSKLIYPKEFKGKIRNVELYGEAFFEVSPDKKKPFIVKTYDISVRVLGTAFNLEAFPDAGEINTTLVHGKVLLEKVSGNKITALAEMSPFEHAVYRTEKQEISVRKESNIDQYIAWKDGKMVFMNASIEEVAKRLELWYNVSVHIKSEELKKAHFTCTFTNETIDQVLKLLKISFPIEYSIIKLDNSAGSNMPIYDITLSSSE
ncbi:MAG TPA: hypothetical protein DIW50_17440 [Prolixibacteraceae bacterium]|nr:hypothetical protein [Prolixibacteraceae bacterium]